jgi:hypothetical protein
MNVKKNCWMQDFPITLGYKLITWDTLLPRASE